MISISRIFSRSVSLDIQSRSRVELQTYKLDLNSKVDQSRDGQNMAYTIQEDLLRGLIDMTLWDRSI